MSLFGRSFCAGALAGFLTSMATNSYGCFFTPSFFGGFGGGYGSSIWGFGCSCYSSRLSYWMA